MKRYWFAVSVIAALAAPAGAQSSLAHLNVFVSGKDGYNCYRIPAIEVAPDGSLLAFAEARKYNVTTIRAWTTTKSTWSASGAPTAAAPGRR